MKYVGLVSSGNGLGHSTRLIHLALSFQEKGFIPKIFASQKQIKNLRSEFDSYSFYAILNNNPKNIEFFIKKVLSFNTKEIIVFDPWRLVNPKQVIYSNEVKIVHYVSLSHYEKLSIESE